MFEWNKLSIRKMAHKEAKIKQMEIETNLHARPLFSIQLANLIPNLLKKKKM
jgi:hypothetical protein